MRETQRKGDTATAQALATFTRLGYDVSIPFTESAAYDLIVDMDGQLYRVQVKYCGAVKQFVDLRQISSNSQGYNVKCYVRKAWDWLYVLRSDGTELLFTQDLGDRTGISVRSNENQIQTILGGLAERTIATTLKVVEA